MKAPWPYIKEFTRIYNELVSKEKDTMKYKQEPNKIHQMIALKECRAHDNPGPFETIRDQGRKYWVLENLNIVIFRSINDCYNYVE